jgi:hypothetical protein
MLPKWQVSVISVDIIYPHHDNPRLIYAVVM